jgi:hypothetical protein
LTQTLPKALPGAEPGDETSGPTGSFSPNHLWFLGWGRVFKLNFNKIKSGVKFKKKKKREKKVNYIKPENNTINRLLVKKVYW